MKAFSNLNVREQAEEFFQFFGSHGIKWFMVEGQPRLKTGAKAGTRGAPIGALYGFRYALHFSKVVQGFLTFEERLSARKKTNVDLQTRESPDRSLGSRIILLDDLEEHRLGELLSWWTGPLVALETSPMNFQSLLISPHGLSGEELLRCQRSGVGLFETDAGATSARQLHRLPGSPNYKGGAMVDGKPFICRTICLQDGDGGDGAEQLRELLDGRHTTSRTRQLPPVVSRQKKDEPDVTNSVLAWQWAVKQLKAGVVPSEVLDGLRTNFLSHHSARDWPKRTLQNAMFHLSMVPSRYESGDSIGKV